MAQLQSIISSVLRDVLVAQHEANIYSMSLSESYRKNGSTELFPLPAIAVGEMEMEIRYGITDVALARKQKESFSLPFFIKCRINKPVTLL